MPVVISINIALFAREPQVRQVIRAAPAARHVVVDGFLAFAEDPGADGAAAAVTLFERGAQPGLFIIRDGLLARDARDFLILPNPPTVGGTFILRPFTLAPKLRRHRPDRQHPPIREIRGKKGSLCRLLRHCRGRPDGRRGIFHTLRVGRGWERSGLRSRNGISPEGRKPDARVVRRPSRALTRWAGHQVRRQQRPEALYVGPW